MSTHHRLQNIALRHSKTARAQASPVRWSRRARRPQLATRNVREPFAPPEDWYEPRDARNGYRIVVQQPGEGYIHVVTPEQVRQRLAMLPAEFLTGLDVVQFSRMTRKKQSFPCYGMQWGSTLYLYPLEESLEEWFTVPPRPEVLNEARMYGGVWDQPNPGSWRLTWSRPAIEDFYLNNILIHELGHLLDDRNSGYVDRERYAEWFAIKYGYQASGGAAARRPKAEVRRRHHAK
ncbi:MAG: hypothetical protein DCC67_09115 [Planctomycetota bacterium]|nr:MAG: hypothetical protein DCC67_09115 [Planctomycetota bacterium]